MSEHPYLLIHGLIGSLRDLAPVFHSQGIQAHTPDLLGYGALQHVDPATITLPGQVAHLARWLTARDIERVHLAGHSVGGAIAMLFATAHPASVASIHSVEGNFSLADAFWSASVAQMTAHEADAMLTQFREKPEVWLARSGITTSASHRATASSLLDNQPASTIQATARSVVAVTGNADYPQAVRKVFEGPVPVHLIAGERSKAGWNVPQWALEKAASFTCLPGGHLMMVEDPARFVDALTNSQKRARDR
ncbi:Pimeloyl-ACP methyl ester carboxylesterase [Pseudomonas flavescens]|uniref:Pimeloyl-ACP methyl ester carboxylesterase n=1 Tax=Phytopseudomonas flavescens TaxID=29435 RepID=A0A1G8PEY6_9GAMM|nr:alpha/beta hydrolase [Pseudomonas flavescens]SDI90878.1 Pimeloyl-ACP methyl ester carboxylesterase [Pseudomonas flavescens]